MSAHAIRDDEQPPAGMAMALLARRGVGAEVLILGAHQPHIGAQDRLNTEARRGDDRLFCRDELAHMRGDRRGLYRVGIGGSSVGRDRTVSREDAKDAKVILSRSSRLRVKR